MKRASLVVPVALAITVLALAGVIALGQPATIAAGPQQPAGSVPAFLPLVGRSFDPDYVSPFGIVMYGAVNDAAGLQVMKQAGSHWISTQLNWLYIEPAKGSLNWSSFDAKAQAAQAAGMELYVLVNDNPPWAAELPGGPVTDTQDLVDFVSLMVERYNCDGTDDAPGHPCVHYWSFYAEPDNGSEVRARYQRVGFWGHNGAGYAAMLHAISPVIHAADPRARVLIGALAYDWFEEDGGPFVRSFLADTLNALSLYPGGATAYLDAVAFHYYPISLKRWPTILDKAKEIQRILETHGAAALPLTCPEAGYWSSSCHGSSDLGQAHWLVQTYVRSASAGLLELSWYKIFDAAVACSPQDTYPDRTSGLFTVDGTAKPAYYAYQTMTRELAQARYVAPLQQVYAEGYRFSAPPGRELTVLWGVSNVRVTFPYTHLRLVTALGQEYDILDNQSGNPGDLDGVVGQITLQIYRGVPYYVERK